MRERWQAAKEQNLVAFLQERVGGSGKSLRRALEANSCSVNGKIERFGSRRIARGDVVEYFFLQKPKSDMAVLWEDEKFLFVDKPVGWICSPSNAAKTFSGKAILVHRLDRDTSGVLWLLRKKELFEEVLTLFRTFHVKKTYLAWVDGIVPQEEGAIENYLGKVGSFAGQTIYGEAKKGLWARTEWKVVRRNKDRTLVRAFPITGRTHQLRVHFSQMGHPILGDRQYARAFRSSFLTPRVLLHSESISFSFQGASHFVAANAFS